MTTAIISTSIFEPDYLKVYEQNLLENGISKEDVNFIVIGDNKSNHEAFGKMQMKLKYPLIYLSPIDQKHWLKENNINDNTMLFPENSSRRRNIGYLLAIKNNYDNYIVIDDDNLPIKGSYWFDRHIKAIANGFPKHYLHNYVVSKNKIVNPCNFLNGTSNICYARGYPIDEYFKDTFDLRYFNTVKSVDVNTSVWVCDPDIDAGLHLLYDNVKVTNAKNMNFVVGYKNYIPINSQNTAVSKRAMPIFWNIHQPKILDVELDRFDDIWNGLFVSKVLHRVGSSVSFGTPVVNHIRNSHNYINDFKKEYIASIINCELWKYVMNDVDLYSFDIEDAYIELATNLTLYKNYENHWINEAINQIGESMKDWITTVTKLKDE
jgi:hypothetical protein